jgi:hypothetical protein
MQDKEDTESTNDKKKKSQSDIDFQPITLFHEDGSTTVYPESHKIASGGSKQIYKLNGDDVIAVVGNNENTRPYIQSEVDFANELRKMGLRTQDYQAAEIEMDNIRIPVLKMASFQSLAQNGHQVRDQKNPVSSAGDSLIFGSKDNLASEEHWRKLMSPLVNDIYIYLINGLNFAGDSWNAVIEDTSETLVKEQQASSLITDRAQEIHLYFFDFGTSAINPAALKTKYGFLDPEGRISEEFISHQVNKMRDKVFSLIVDTCSSQREYNSIILGNKKMYEPVFEKIWSEISNTLCQKIKTHLEGLSEEELFENFNTHSKETITKFRQLRLDREYALQQLKEMDEELPQQEVPLQVEEHIKPQKEEEKNNKIDDLMKNIDITLDDFLNKINNIDHHSSEAQTTAERLYSKLHHARSVYETQLKTGMNENQENIGPSAAGRVFNDKCAKAIRKAMPVLERDLGWGDYLLNILKVCANAVIKGVTGTNNNLLTPVQSELSMAASATGKSLQSEEMEETSLNQLKM